MRKTSKIIVIIVVLAILLLGVGYAAVQNITLTINGTAKADVSTLDFDVRFIGTPEIIDPEYIQASIDSSNLASFEVSGFTSVGQTASVIFTIKNSSSYMSANLKIETFSNTEYFTTKWELAKTGLKSEEETSVKVTVELVKMPTTSSVTSGIQVRLAAKQVPPGYENTGATSGELLAKPTDLNNGMYSVIEKVTPTTQDLFNIEILDESKKTAKITGIKTEYIRRIDKDNYYNLNKDGFIDTLVVPYEVKPIGKTDMYTVTEVKLDCENTMDYVTIKSEQEGFDETAVASIPNVKRIIYPNTVTKIESDVSRSPYDQKSLEEVVLPNKLEILGNYIFGSCPNLKSIIFPDTLTSIGDYAFYNCTSLKNLVIPYKVKNIGDYAFQYCIKLENVEFMMSNTVSWGEDCFKTYLDYFQKLPSNECYTYFYFESEKVQDTFEEAKCYILENSSVSGFIIED